MTFPASERIVFKENPLAEVICQLRFPTILAIAAEVPAAFQERIREGYPVYRRNDPLAVQPPEVGALLARLPLQAPEGAAEHNFVTEDGSRTITLASTFLAVTETDYKD